MRFKIGDYVQVIPNNHHVYTTGGQSGQITKIIGGQYCCIDWDDNTMKQFQRRGFSPSETKNWAIEAEYLKKLDDPQWPHLSKVERRIRTLWNESNYVKAHPNQAYS